MTNTHEPHTVDRNGSSDRATTGRVVAEAARVYEEFFVPALFGQWPDRVLDVAGVDRGDRVLDVGCGTGVLARTAAGRVGPRGAVVGVDPNPDMLTVARRSPGAVDWFEAPAEGLPFGDGGFDRVVSQFAAMFFADRDAALGEARRVLRPGGTLTIATWASLDETPGYAAMVELLGRLFGERTASALVAPYTMGDPDDLTRLLGAQVTDVEVTRLEGVARFASIDAWVHTDVRGWTLADAIDEEQYRTLLAAARRELAGFVAADGTVEFPAPALVATGTRR